MLTILVSCAQKSVPCRFGTRTSSGPNGPRGIEPEICGPEYIGMVPGAYDGHGRAEWAFYVKIWVSSDPIGNSDTIGKSVWSDDTQPGCLSGWFWALFDSSFTELSNDTLYAEVGGFNGVTQHFSRGVAGAFNAWNGHPRVACGHTARKYNTRFRFLGESNLEYAAAWLERVRRMRNDRRTGGRGCGDNALGMLVPTIMLALVLTVCAIYACDTLWLFLGRLMSSAFAALTKVLKFVCASTAWAVGGVGVLLSAAAGLGGSVQDVERFVAGLTFLTYARRILEPGMVRFALAAFWFVQPVGAVCHVCHGFFEGCNGGGDGWTCAGAAAVAGNAAAIATAGGAALTLVGLFDVRVLRVFTSTVLAVLKQYALAPVAGTPFDFDGQTNAQVVGAVLSGSLSKTEALRHFTAKIEVVAAIAEEGPRTAQMASLEAQLRLLQAVDERPSTSNSATALAGVMHFAWGKCSEVVLGGDGKITLGTDKEKTSTSTITARILVPTTAEEFFEILALWQAIVVQVGLAPFMVVHSVVQRTVWHPIRTVKMPWAVAHELLLAHLDRVDQSVDRSVRLANVCDKVGVDVLRAEAIEKALTRFGAKFQSDIFRFSGGARAPSGEREVKGVVYNGKTSQNSTRPCEAYNRGVDHLAKHLHPDGTCKFKHACGKWIKMPDGTVGFCMRSHPMGQCDRDPAECSKVGPRK